MPQVTFIVKDSGGATAPIEKARIRITQAEGRGFGASGETDENGRYKKDLAPDTYRVRVEAFGLNWENMGFVVGDDPFSETINLAVGANCTTLVEKDGVEVTDTEFTEGTVVILRADPNRTDVNYAWVVDGGSLVERVGDQNRREVHWDTTRLRARYTARMTVSEKGSAQITVDAGILVLPRPTSRVDTVPVTMRRSAVPVTIDLPLWVIIRKSTEAIQFRNYLGFMDMVLCGKPLRELQDVFTPGELGIINAKTTEYAILRNRRNLPFTDTEAYRLLKVATEAFLSVNCGVWSGTPSFSPNDVDDLNRRGNFERFIGAAELDNLWDDYLEAVNGTTSKIVPYLAVIRRKLPDAPIKTAIFDGERPQDCYGILQDKLANPCLLELIWSYWHEEGMLVQSINAISRRFQNIQGAAERDPLSMMELDPLRPLNNLLWGYLQDEQHRLSVVRRAYEYDHHYGLALQGKAVPALRTADSRNKFLEAFHNLLSHCAVFFKEDDDTTVVADGFPVLNALKDVHMLLAEGAHNQFGDLPATARIEMLMQQWLLARPEFREVLPTRIMVAYPEPWMDRVDAMKKVQGWTDTNILHFRNLGIFGEQILLSVRFGNWTSINDPASAANWARFWRAEIQGYIHAYRAVTGVDLTADVTSPQELARRATLPSTLIRERLASGSAEPMLSAGAATALPAPSTLGPSTVSASRVGDARGNRKS